MPDAEPAAYDDVAELYDRAFSDIRVRRVEWRWLTAQFAALPLRPRVLELGCGTGAVLRALAPYISTGTGVDISSGMLARAKARASAEAGLERLSFVRIGDHRLPFQEASFDVVISFLSFRYLDWPLALAEVRRVLRAGGLLLLIDLVAAQARPRELPALVRSGLRHVAAGLSNPRFAREVAQLASQPAWRAMLQRHPIRAFAEYRRFFAEQRVVARFETLDMTPSRRVVALACRP